MERGKVIEKGIPNAEQKLQYRILKWALWKYNVITSKIDENPNRSHKSIRILKSGNKNIKRYEESKKVTKNNQRNK